MDQMTLTKPPRGVLGHSALEVGAWLVALCTAALSYAIAGAHGYTGNMDAQDLLSVTQLQRAGDFNVQFAAPALLVMAILVLAGLLVPTAKVRKLGSAQRTQLLMVSAIVTAVLGIVTTFALNVWLTWAVALSLGVLVVMTAAHTPQLHRKPWRTAGVSTGIFLFLTYLFQLNGGVPAGTSAVRWLMLVGAIILAVSAVLVIIAPISGQELPEDTAGFPLTRSLNAVRGHMRVTFAWACYVLFGILGGVFVLSLPSVADNGFGQAGFGLVVAAVLFGWAAGYEAGPTFAPGMTRPRLTSFALIAASVFTIGAGVITELSGKAVLSALVAFCAGIGTRSQDYTFSRRVGITAGVFVALLMSCFDFGFTAQLSPVSEWVVSGSAVAYLLVGFSGLILGIIAIFLFSPQGVQGLAVDLVHAFRNPHDSSAQSGGPAEPCVVFTESPTAADEDESAGLGQLTVPVTHYPESGLFIAIEGGDGTGKTTQIARVREYLEELGFDPVTTSREPGGTPKGQGIRSVLLDGDGVTERSEALLYAADRAHHIASLVEPILTGGGAVVTDRYIDSSLAYQAAGRDLSAGDVLSLSRWATRGLLPQLTIVLDLDPAVAMDRMGGRDESNHFDQQDFDFKSRVRSSFLELAQADPERYAVIDAAQSPEAVFADIRAALGRVAVVQELSAAAELQKDALPEVGADSGRSSAQPAPHSFPDDGQSQTADGFAPKAPRGRCDGVPTERISESEMAERYGEVPAFLADDAPTTVLDHDAGHRQDASADAVTAEEEKTRVISDAGRCERADSDDVPAPDADDVESKADEVSDGDAPTTVLPAHSEDTGERRTRRPNVDRLRAQARIERQARERLRQSRERGDS